MRIGSKRRESPIFSLSPSLLPLNLPSSFRGAVPSSPTGSRSQWLRRGRESHRRHRRRGLPEPPRTSTPPPRSSWATPSRTSSAFSAASQRARDDPQRRRPAGVSRHGLYEQEARLAGGQDSVSPHRLRTDEAGGRARPGAVLGEGAPAGLGTSHRGGVSAALRGRLEYKREWAYDYVVADFEQPQLGEGGGGDAGGPPSFKSVTIRVISYF